LLELARAIAAMPTDPSRTVLFASWNAEEVGLIGSCHYVREDPRLPLDDTILAFSIDMVGAGAEIGLDLNGGTDPGATWVVDLMRASAAEREIDYRIEPSDITLNSDHACFADAGVTALMATSIGPHPDYHTPRNTSDRIDPDDLYSSAVLMWALLEPLSMGRESDYLD
jgi:aminopeptidase YwaD